MVRYNFLAAVALLATLASAATVPATSPKKELWTPLKRLAKAKSDSTHGGITPQIVNGQVVAAGEAPFTVRVSTWFSLCTGVLIRPNVVLTAGHCVETIFGGIGPGWYFTVYAGSTSASGGTKYSVSKVTRHPDYNTDDLKGDIALLTLSSSVPNSSNASPIKIYTGQNAESDVVTAVGFGVDQNGNTPSQLMKADLKVGPTAECITGNTNYTTPNDIWVCTKYTLTNTAVCNGDSGGPLVRPVSSGGSGPHGWALVGTTSFGNVEKCNDPTSLDFFVHSNYYINWIATNAGASVGDITIGA
ncbi:trypsin-like serine protease [Ramicandelaber brevisporus]|nr:trypsin-like serine protease [Ramicandelaber brevisporus]